MKTIEESVVKIMFFGVIFPQLFYLDCWFIYFKWKTNTFKTFFIYITSMQIHIKGCRLISCWTFVLPPWKVFRNISLLFFSQALFNRSKRCYYNELWNKNGSSWSPGSSKSGLLSIWTIDFDTEFTHIKLTIYQVCKLFILACDKKRDVDWGSKIQAYYPRRFLQRIGLLH